MRKATIAGNAPPLIIPSETKVREFDAKLLLACCAAERGLRSIVGSRERIHARAASLPRGIYIGKDFRRSSRRMTRIFDRLGHRLCGWDEECLLYFSREQYYQTRIDPEVFGATALHFAWGDQDQELFAEAEAGRGAPIKVTGNPRIDLLRPELRGFFDDEAARIRDRFGEYILVSTHFGAINHFIRGLSSRTMNSLTPATERSGDFQSALKTHLYSVFDHFKAMIAALSEAFADRTILVRPHPAENRTPWESLASSLPNVVVHNEGNVVPWIFGADVLVHNSCTTSVESFVLDRPAVAFLPVISERFDLDLANSLGEQARDVEELIAKLKPILSADGPHATDQQQRKLLSRSIAALDGPLASDRIARVIEEEIAGTLALPTVNPSRQRAGRLLARLRAAEKWLNSRRSGSKNSVAYQSQRFPGISVDEVARRIDRLGKQLGRFGGISVNPLSRDVFEIIPPPS